ncbi:5111_t:CDS:2, partial [Ambispora leptoticha]
MNNVAEALLMTRKYIDQNPNILSGHRLLFEILYNYKHDEEIEWVNAGKIYHRMDPSSPEQLVLRPLCKYYKKLIRKAEKKINKKREKNAIIFDAHQNIAELMLQRIEYGDDSLSTISEALKRLILSEKLSPNAPSRLFSPATARDTWMTEFFRCLAIKRVNTSLRLKIYKALSVYSGFKIIDGFFGAWLNSWKDKVASGEDQA